jgi:hypothetical protein
MERRSLGRCEIGLVAGDALGSRVPVRSALVASLASRHAMPAFQPESGQAVPEPFGEPVFRGMAVAASRRPELVKVRVSMAFGALRPEAGVDSFSLVAIAAGHLGVRPLQPKSGDLVEETVRLPVLGCVTLFALLAHFSFVGLYVVFGVAVDAGHDQRTPHLALVAFETFGFDVLTFEREAGLGFVAEGG